jgi:hypothetical protein
MKKYALFFAAATTVSVLLPEVPVRAQPSGPAGAIRVEPAPPQSGSAAIASDGLRQDGSSGPTPAGQPYLSGPNSVDRTWLLPVTDESRIVEDDRGPASETRAEGGPKPARQQDERPRYRDESNKSNGHILVRTTRFYPQPDIRRALSREEQIALTEYPADHRNRAALRSELRDFHFTETPLRDVIAQLKDMVQIPIQLDLKALEDQGVDLEAPITKDISGVELRSALRLILGDLDLTYLVKDEVLLITTKEKASENLIVRRYPMPSWIPVDEALIDTVQNVTGGPGAWADGGGIGAIRPGPGRSNSLIVSQTEEVHEEVVALLDEWMGDDLALLSAEHPPLPKTVPTRLYRILDESLIKDLPAKLTQLCNVALAERGDPEAKITVLGNRIVVQSRNRAFHIYTAELVQALNGEDVTTTESLFDPSRAEPDIDASQNYFQGGMGGMGGGMGFCWVAREVYGPHDPRWLVFRDWLSADAPSWLLHLYERHGQAFADWIHDRPLAKAAVRAAMDRVVEPRLAATGRGMFTITTETTR